MRIQGSLFRKYVVVFVAVIGGMLIVHGLIELYIQNVNFGFEGVAKTVGQLPHPSAHAVCDELINAVNKHQAGSLQHDDMTAVVVRAV
jgi:serine phosphatase RsbU (regulator of sigma subunit)